MSALRDTILHWIDKRMNDMLSAPRAWGSDEAIEMQVLLLLQFRALTLRPNFDHGDPGSLVDAYMEYLTRTYPKHPHQPLHQIVEADRLGFNIANELKKVIQTFTQSMLEENPFQHNDLAIRLEETYLPLVEEAATRKVSLALKYLSTGSDEARWQHVSVQSVVIGHPTRFIAVCHESNSLKWFRLDRAHRVQKDDAEPFREAEPGQVEAMLKESVDGFHHGGPVQCSFFVREPECRWVEGNLPLSMASMTAEKVPGGMRFTTMTAGVLRLARFVVGLGGAARAETPELAALVQELAHGALGLPT